MNAIRCKHCDTVIQSMHRHDYRVCKCGACFVDGGNDYSRRGYPGGNPEDHFEVIGEPEPQVIDTGTK